MKVEDGRELNYSDVYLIPKKTIVDTRKNCDTSIDFGPRTFVSPVYPSNMKSVVDKNTCKYLAKKCWFYSMHRFSNNCVEFMRDMIDDNLFTSISTGIKDESYESLKSVYDNGLIPDYITLDVANAWSVKAEKMVKWIKEHFPSSFLIVGNVATPDAVKEIEGWGASALKIGISGGKVCITKNKTGFHRPMVSTIIDCFHSTKLPLIADGGIVEHGDIAKAIACGATMVMAGSLFAGYDESAGSIIDIEDNYYKEYFGSASKYNKDEQEHIEGKKILIKYRGSMDKLLQELLEDLRSSVSYSGGTTLRDLKKIKIIAVR